MNALHTKLTLDHDGTHYVMHDMMLTNGDHLICIETGWGSGYGQWIHLDVDSIAWSYLTEKMPGLRDGDKPGYKMMFAKAGIEVFG